jgi:uncharacterized membrane protein YdcZ (DUF606 family)
MLFRIFAYLFHGLLALFLLGVSAVALLSGPETLRLDMLPWTGSTLKYAVFAGSLIGLILVLLSILGKLRPLFFVWTLLVMALMLRGYLLGSYHFAGPDVRTAVYLMAGSVISVLGGWFQMWKPRWKTHR